MPASVDTAASGSASSATWRLAVRAGDVCAFAGGGMAGGMNEPIAGIFGSAARRLPSSTCRSLFQPQSNRERTTMDAPVIDPVKLEAFAMRAVGDFASAYTGLM